MCFSLWSSNQTKTSIGHYKQGYLDEGVILYYWFWDTSHISTALIIKCVHVSYRQGFHNFSIIVDVTEITPPPPHLTFKFPPSKKKKINKDKTKHSTKYSSLFYCPARLSVYFFFLNKYMDNTTLYLLSCLYQPWSCCWA